MANRTDVDSRAIADDTVFNDGGHRMTRARSADAITQKEDLIDFVESEEEGFSPVTPEGQSGRSVKEPAVSKQKKSIPKRVINYFTGASSPEGSQQEPHDTDIEDLQASLDDQRNTNSGLKKATRKAEAKLQRLKSKYQSARQEIEMLSQREKDAREANQNLVRCLDNVERDLKAEKQDHREDISRLEGQVKALTRTSDQLRQMLVPASEKQTYDQEVISRFSNLNKSILGLVRQTWTTAFVPDFDLRRLSQSQNQLFGEFLPLSYDRLRSLVFLGIKDFIFGPQLYFLGQRFQEMEQRIQDVERDLNRNLMGDDRQRIMEWRDATFKATESFRDNGSQLSSIARNRIWDFLSPLQVKDTAADRERQDQLQAICDKAVELSLMIRQLKDHFKIDDMYGAVGQPVSHWDEWVEEFASIPAPAGVQSGTIAYVIHGALVKSPKEDLGRNLVLEKAEVAVYQ